jgi:hypothetical protein
MTNKYVKLVEEIINEAWISPKTQKEINKSNEKNYMSQLQKGVWIEPNKTYSPLLSTYITRWSKEGKVTSKTDKNKGRFYYWKDSKEAQKLANQIK